MVTRSDLSPGQQATQSTHAAFKFAHEHPALMDSWYRESTYLVLLATPDEPSLAEILFTVDFDSLVFSAWREPDMDDALTAIAIAPSPMASKLLANLPLTLREPAMT